MRYRSGSTWNKTVHQVDDASHIFPQAPPFKPWWPRVSRTTTPRRARGADNLGFQWDGMVCPSGHCAASLWCLGARPDGGSGLTARHGRFQEESAGELRLRASRLIEVVAARQPPRRRLVTTAAIPNRRGVGRAAMGDWGVVAGRVTQALAGGSWPRTDPKGS